MFAKTKKLVYIFTTDKKRLIVFKINHKEKTYENR